jgi:hypothetical protein
MSASLAEIQLFSNILPDGQALKGVLQSVKPIGEGLLEIKINNLTRLVSDELMSALAGKEGHFVRITHLGRWSAWTEA